MRQRSQLIAWKVGARPDRQTSADEVVRETGGSSITSRAITSPLPISWRREMMRSVLEAFGLRNPENQQQTMIEIGSGIGRMTAAFTQELERVIAADLDTGFLERCYETVSRFGGSTICVPLKLRTVCRSC